MNKSLKNILQRTTNYTKSNWHLMLYLTLWAHRTSIKTTIGFSPFQLIYGIEEILYIECQILSLKLEVHLFPDTSPLEELLLYLKQLDEKHCDEALANEAHKK